MERLSMKQVRSQAKIVGTLLSVGGAMLMTLYKGPAVHMFWSPHHHHHDKYVKSASAVPDKDWIKGSLLVIASCLAWAGFFVLQVLTIFMHSSKCIYVISWFCLDMAIKINMYIKIYLFIFIGEDWYF